MLKTTTTIRAYDGTQRVDVTIKGFMRHLSRLEVARVRRALTRAVAEALKGIPYTDFGIDNMEIR